MRIVGTEPAPSGLFSCLGSAASRGVARVRHAGPPGVTQGTSHESGQQDEGLSGMDTGPFEGQMLQEVADAVARADRPTDPDSVFAALVGAVGRDHATRPPSGGSGVFPDVLDGPTMLGVPKIVKKAFDFYFRQDLYGHYIQENPIILSSGSYAESVFGLPDSLKACVRYALDRNWYGYSDSLGRSSAREALARLETARGNGTVAYQADNIAVTMGGTAALSSRVDLIADRSGRGAHAVACVPNYPPLVASMAQRLPTRLVPTPLVNGRISVEPLLEALREEPAVVLLQVVVNPWGLRVSEMDIARVIAALPAGCFLLLDECHDTAGPVVAPTPARLHERVLSIRSMSKRWAAPGLKAGWIVAHRGFLDDFYEHASTTYGGPASLLYLLLEMYALLETAQITGTDLSEHKHYLRSEYGVTAERLATAVEDYFTAADRMARLVTSRREYATARLRAVGIPVLAAEYSINLTVRMGDTPSYSLYRQLVSEAGVSAFPGLLTMGDCRGVLRISPCLDETMLENALDRMVAWHVSRR